MHDRDNPALLAELNDLLQLEYDALPAYTLAIRSLRTEAWREALTRFRGDHQRHAADLAAMIRAHGGRPLRLPHVPTGAFKLMVQAWGIPGGDRSVLIAFKSNEWQSRNKYARHAARPHAPEVAALLDRHAADEARHYAWVTETLDAIGAGTGTPIGLASGVFARIHGMTADAIESAERNAMEAVSRAVRAG